MKRIVTSFLEILLALAVMPVPARAAPHTPYELSNTLHASHWQLIPSSGPLRKAESQPVHTFGLRESQAVARGITVKVINQGNGQPVPGATVMISGPSSISERFSRIYGNRAPGGGEIRVRLQGGQRFICDQAGQTRIPYAWAHQFGGILLAAHGVYAGIAKSDALRGDQLQIELRLSKEVRVRVRNESGAPVAGIPVAIQSAPAMMKMGNSSDIVEEVTNGGGLVTLPYAGLLCSALGISSSVAGFGKTETTVRLVASLSHEVSKTVDLTKDIDAPIDLILPQTRPVTVRVRTKDGEAPPKGTRVFLSTAAADTPNNLWYRSRLYNCDAKGDGVIPYVGPLERWRVSAFHPSIPAACVMQQNASTAEAVPEFIDIIWNPTYTVYTGSIKRANGRAARNTSLTVQLSSPSGETEELELDAQGRFKLPWEPLEKYPLPVLLTLPGTEPPERILFELPKCQGGPRELADITLQPSKLMARGIVATAEGKGVPGARIYCAASSKDGRTPRSRLVPSPFPTLTDFDGKFRVYAINQDLEKPFILMAKHPSFSSTESAAVTVGTEGVQLTMLNSGSLNLSVKLPKGFEDIGQVAIELEPQDDLPPGDARKLRAKRALMGNQLQISWPSLPIGRYDVHVSLTQWGAGSRPDDPNADMEPDTAPVERSHTPRLLTDPTRGALTLFNLPVAVPALDTSALPVLDLASLVRVINVSILDKDKKPAAPLMFELESTALKLRRMAFEGIKDKQYLFAKAAEDIEVKVQADGFDAQEFTLKGSSIQLVMTRPNQSKVELHGSFPPTSVVSLRFSQDGKFSLAVSMKHRGPSKPLVGTTKVVPAGTYEIEVSQRTLAPGKDPKTTSRSLGLIEVKGTPNEIITIHAK